MNVTLSRLFAVFTGIAIVTPAAAQYPTDPPAPMPMRQLQLPPFQEFQLPNGLDVVLVQDHDLPAVIVEVPRAELAARLLAAENEDS